MDYISTRGMAPAVDSAQAVLNGLAPDGGLYVPKSLPPFDWKDCLAKSSQGMSQAILSALLPDIPHMDTLVKNAYTGKFETEDLTPSVPVGDMTVCELFRGPTSAFKDVALSMLPQLLTAAKEEKGIKEEIRILTATSGDTGKAALVGFRDVPGVSICVFYPQGGVSQVQRAQMVTQEGKNVAVCAVEGNFDDAQTGVKHIFRDTQGKKLPFRLSSANSINIGRLAPQIMYYFRAYRDLVDRKAITLGDKVDFSVPTGNFGDILAGYLTKKLGLPVGRLYCASNANNVLTDFLTTGVYDRRRPLLKTTSPSMDILVSSNLERLLYLMSEDTALVAGLMKDLNEKGFYKIPDALLTAIRAEFGAGYCDDSQAGEVMGRVYKDYGYLMDPHTASGWYVAEKNRGENKMVVLSTASPYKFSTAVLSAIGGSTEGTEYERMDRLNELTGVPIPKNLASLRGKPELHTDVIAKGKMLEYVIGK